MLYHRFALHRQEWRSCLFLLFVGVMTHPIRATTWEVGPKRIYTFCSQVAPLVSDGDTIAIDYATYYNDPQVTWNQNNLYIVGIGGRPRLEAGPVIAADMVNGKGIFVTRGANIHIHNIEFANAVVQDNNGAGIRQEGPGLTVTLCRFVNNEMGILCGNIANCKTTVEYSQFLNGGSTLNPGYQHNIYINHIDTLVFRYNDCRDAIAEGHELKSRATYNFILYNRIANESTEDSRTIDLPNGGVSVIMGNIIEQGPLSANSNILGYGLEGLSNPASHVLYCINNTFINKRHNGNFIQVATGTDSLVIKNNLFAGPISSGLISGSYEVLDSSNNLVQTDLDAFGFEDHELFDYHLLADAPARDAGMMINTVVNGYSLHARQQYVDTCAFEARPEDGLIDIGAFEYPTTLKTITQHEINLLIYPNPASGMLTIEIPQDQKTMVLASLHNMTGSLCKRLYLNSGKNQLDLDGILPGVYFLYLKTTRTPQIHHVIVIQ